MSSPIDKWLSVGTVAMLLVALSPWAARFWPREPVTVRVGDRIVSKLADKHQWTLVAVLSADCEYCTNSIPFYKRLRENNNHVAFIVAGKNANSLVEYSRSHGLQATRYESITLDELRFPVTPFLLLVDPEGLVRHVWAGQLSAAGERSVESETAKLRNLQ
jgi:hypothetical protein